VKYNTVIFDLFGTLVDNFVVPDYHNVLAEMAGVLKVPTKSFSQLWRDYFNQRVNGTHPTHEKSIEIICRDLGVTVTEKQVNRAADIRLAYTVRCLKPRPDAIPVIKKLKSLGYKVGLISDCSPETPKAWPATAFPPLFNVTIFSCVVGTKKPDPRIYRLATDALRVKPQECLYIGDGSSNELTGALGVGMHPVLIRDAGEYDDTPIIKREDDWQGPKITSLKQVLDLLE
jgi:putative hydrolase of the HAD superfamily